jgi:hypothetical protein
MILAPIGSVMPRRPPNAPLLLDDSIAESHLAAGAVQLC